MLIPDFSLVVLTFPNLAEGLFYRNLTLCNTLRSGKCLVPFDVQNRTDGNCHVDTTMEILAKATWWSDSPMEGPHNNFIKSNPKDVNLIKMPSVLCGTSVAKSGHPDQTALIGNGLIWVHAVCFYFFVGALGAKLTLSIYGMSVMAVRYIL